MPCKQNFTDSMDHQSVGNSLRVSQKYENDALVGLIQICSPIACHTALLANQSTSTFTSL